MCLYLAQKRRNYISGSSTVLYRGVTFLIVPEIHNVLFGLLSQQGVGESILC